MRLPITSGNSFYKMKSRFQHPTLILRDKTIRLLVSGNYKSRFASLLPEILNPSTWLDFWFVKPMNGQSCRIKHLVRLADSFSPTIAIETGTYFGTSTPFLSRLVDGKTFTIESDSQLFQKAKERLNNESKYIEVIHGDSTEEMREILKKVPKEFERVIAYLDAHWYARVPTREEIEILFNWGGSWIAIIDDFQIISDSGYTYDKYGDQIVGKDMVPRHPGIEVWVSQVNSEFETGAKRGTGYVFSPGTRAKLTELAMRDLVQIL